MAVAPFDGPAISVVIVGSIGTFLTFVGVFIAIMQYRTRLHQILDEERVTSIVALASSGQALHDGFSSVSHLHTLVKGSTLGLTMLFRSNRFSIRFSTD
jgi:hypothetical protein